MTSICPESRHCFRLATLLHFLYHKHNNFCLSEDGRHHYNHELTVDVFKLEPFERDAWILGRLMSSLDSFLVWFADASLRGLRRHPMWGNHLQARNLENTIHCSSLTSWLNVATCWSTFTTTVRTTQPWIDSCSEQKMLVLTQQESSKENYITPGGVGVKFSPHDPSATSI